MKKLLAPLAILLLLTTTTLSASANETAPAPNAEAAGKDAMKKEREEKRAAEKNLLQSF